MLPRVGMKGMVQRRQRGCFRHAVALHQHEAKRIPELFDLCRQRSAAGDEGPEFKAEAAMHVAHVPPFFPDALVLDSR